MRKLKLIDNDENHLNNNVINKSMLVLRRWRPRRVSMKEATPRMSIVVRSHS